MWRRVSEVFARVRDECATRRDAILSRECGDDPALREQVEALLAHTLPSTPAADILAPHLVGLPPERLVGTTLGGYTLLEAIGEGGMGCVFRARDHQLQRDVAVKVLTTGIAAVEEWRASLEREARILASLNDPHIAVIHGIAEGEGVRGLVMELVDGQTLATRLHRGAPGQVKARFTLEEILRIAGQLASALETAHDRGIVHRDLKPANIALTTSGDVKVLDFGLARAPVAATEHASGVGVNASTREPGATAIAGTLPYMSPEQVRGGSVDKRTDIFAFGCVLFEMLTGTRAFAGTDLPAHLTDVAAGPRWSDLTIDVPAPLAQVLRRCLDPDEKRRLRDIGEARVVIEDLLAAPVPSRRGERATRRLARVAVLAAVGLTAVGVWTGYRQVTATPTVSPQHVALPVGDEHEPLVRGIAVSSGGRHVAFISSAPDAHPTTQLCVRSLDRIETSCLAGTEGAVSPFFSPDGEWIAYFAGHELRKVAVTGGPSTVVTDRVDPTSNKTGTWAPDGTIVFSNQRSLMRVSATTGGDPVAVRTADVSQGELMFESPLLLPDARTLIYVVWFGPGWNERMVMAERLGSGERRALFNSAGRIRYAASGHLVYSHAGTLTRVPFDVSSLTVSGVATDLPERVRETTATADWDLATDGTLAFVEQSAAAFLRMPVLVDLRGNATPLRGIVGGFYQHPAISPDGRKAAFMRTDGSIDIWVYDFARASLARLTTEGSSQFPVWSADGRRIVYRATRGSTRSLYWRSVDGASPEEPVFASERWPAPWSMSRDGRFLLFDQLSPGEQDVSLLSLDERRARPLTTGLSTASKARFSPDGAWFAYVSDRTGQEEVYLQSTSADIRMQVSSGGGSEPVWAPDGHTLYFRRGTAMMGTRMTPGNPPAFGEARELFDQRFTNDGPVANLDMHPDGRHFLMLQPVAADPSVRYINLVFHALEAPLSQIR